DFAADVSDSDWITEIAEYGRELAEEAPGPRIVGHVDWRPDNVRIDDRGALVAVYDWDSIQLTGRVHMLAGASTGWSPEGMAAFLDAYGRHAGLRLSVAERRAVAGRVIWSHAIRARFELIRGVPEDECRFVPRLRDDLRDYVRA